MSAPVVISGLHILQDQGWVREHALMVDGSKIAAISPYAHLAKVTSVRHWRLPSHYYLVPGFIDLHIHGADGCDVMDGNRQALPTISAALAREGVTGFLATTMNSSIPHLEATLSLLAAQQAQLQHAALLGVHLEGPFLAPSKAGAQDAAYCLNPDVSLIERWQQQFAGLIKVITLAPELPAMTPFIQAVQALGVQVSIGHTNATYEQTCQAVAAGARQATHLFNAMRGLHQREPGAVGALLLAKELSCEVIVDGLHLHPAVVQLILQLKTVDNLLLVTDAMRAKCLGDGHYALGGQAVEVRQGKACLEDGTLAGSTLTMPQAIQNMVRFTHCSLAEAIRMASFNPARSLGLAESKGSLAVGKDADMVILNADWQVVLTMRAGDVIFQAEHVPALSELA